MILMSERERASAVSVATFTEPVATHVAEETLGRPASTAASEAQPEVVQSSVHGSTEYLPLAGSLDLRFAEPEQWPKPLPEPEVAEPIEESLEEVAFSDPEPMSVAPSPMPVEPPTGVTHISSGSTKSAPASSAPVGFSNGAAAGTVALTAEMVRGFLDRIDEPAYSRDAQFRPAVPAQQAIPLARANVSP